MRKKTLVRNLKLSAMAVLVLLSLSGCSAVANGIVGGANIAMHGGTLVDMPSTDAYQSSVKIPSLPPGQFMDRVIGVARDLGYRIDGADDSGARVIRESRNLADAVIGRDWAEVLAINLDKDGRTVLISAKTQGNNHRGDPGTAKKIIEEFKAHLLSSTVTAKK